MKKIIALLLALSKIFALCACGGETKDNTKSNTTAQQNSSIVVTPRKITVTLRGETKDNTKSNTTAQQNSSIVVTPRKITVTLPGYQIQTIDLPDDTDYLEISNPKLTKVNGSIYRLSYDAKCLFPEDLGVNYPNFIRIHHQYSDKNGNAIKSTSDSVYSFIYGQNFTMDPSIHTDVYNMSDYLLDIAEVESIIFTTYAMNNNTDSPTWVGDWQFIKPVEFSISDLLPEDEIRAAKEWASKGIDPIQAEVVHAENGEKKLRIVNSGDNNQDCIIIGYQELDKDGDIIGESGIYISGLEAGQGTKEKLYFNNEVSAIKITYYVYPHNRGSSWITSVEEKFSMKNPITLSIDAK